MEFKPFENKTNPLEYLQIFVFEQVEIKGNQNLGIEEYHTFELTDTLIQSFDNWVVSRGYIDSRTTRWIEENTKQVDQFLENFDDVFKPKVAIWSDRKKNAYYKGKLQDSFEFENYIAQVIAENYGLDLGQYLTPQGQYELGENALGIEIKNDTLISKYGNVYIEYQEKSSGGNHAFVNSGILKNDNCQYFLIGTRKKFYIFRKERLVQLLKEEYPLWKAGKKSARNIVFKEIPTSRGFTYPIKNAVNDTIAMDTMISEIQAKLKR